MYKRTHRGRFLVTELKRGGPRDAGADGSKRKLLGGVAASSSASLDAVAPKKLRTKSQVCCWLRLQSYTSSGIIPPRRRMYLARPLRFASGVRQSPKQNTPAPPNNLPHRATPGAGSACSRAASHSPPPAATRSPCQTPRSACSRRTSSSTSSASSRSSPSSRRARCCSTSATSQPPSGRAPPLMQPAATMTRSCRASSMQQMRTATIRSPPLLH